MLSSRRAAAIAAVTSFSSLSSTTATVPPKSKQKDDDCEIIESGGGDESDPDFGDTDDSEFSPSESENDRDSDLDFSVNERSSGNRTAAKKNRGQRNRYVTAATPKSTAKLPTLQKKRSSLDEDAIAAVASAAASASSSSLSSSTTMTPTNVTNKKKVTMTMMTTTNTPTTMTTPTLTTPKSQKKLNKTPPAGVIFGTNIITGTGGGGTSKSKQLNTFKSPGHGMAKVISVQIIKPANSPLPTAMTTLTPTTSTTKLTKTIPAIAAIPSLAPISTPPVKKERKPAPHVEALFTDMTSLFSTPDIIKKVGDTNRLQPVAPPPPTPPPQQSNPPAYGNKFYMQAGGYKARFPQPLNKTHQTITSPPSNLGVEQDKQLDLIDSIVQQELQLPNTSLSSQQKSQQLPSSTTSSIAVTTTSSMAIPNIVKMLEHSVMLPPQETPSISHHHIHQDMSFNPNDILDDADLLASLGHPDDGLTEDLLQHVAKLVEDKNLQEVIDKQVLGVVTTTPTAAAMTTTTTTPTAPQPQPKLKPNQRTQIATTQPRTPPQQKQTPVTTPQPPVKEPIKIIRSDGRVITLPPIEAPTTRAKRRALNNQPSSVVTTPEVTPQNSPAPTARRGSSAKQKPAAERRLSVAALKKAESSPVATPKTSRQSSLSEKAPPSTAAALNPLGVFDDDDDDDDDGSDGSYNSEDDPYR